MSVQEEFEGTKGAIIIRISKKNRQHNGQQKVQKDKQRSTRHAYKTKDRVTRTPLKTGCELRCSGGASSSCSTSGTRRVNLVSNPVISREWGKNREVFTTIGTYPWSFVTQIFHNGQPSHDGDHNRCLMSAISLREQDTLWRKYDDILDQKTKS